MLELNNERLDQILHIETPKTEPLPVILRCIYTRYIRLYEQYFADIDALNDKKIAELRKFHEETLALVKYYYMDIPHDICMDIDEFEEKFSDDLLGYNWHEVLFENYEEFRERYEDEFEDVIDSRIKKEYRDLTMKAFYLSMDDIFRDGFGTSSRNASEMLEKLSGLFFEK